MLGFCWEMIVLVAGEALGAVSPSTGLPMTEAAEVRAHRTTSFFGPRSAESHPAMRRQRPIATAATL